MSPGGKVIQAMDRAVPLLIWLTVVMILLAVLAALLHEPEPPLAKIGTVVEEAPKGKRFARELLTITATTQARTVLFDTKSGDIIVLFKAARRGGCYVVLEPRGELVLAPAPTCGVPAEKQEEAR